MKKALTSEERALRIELTRSRAAIERQKLGRNVQSLGVALQPSHLVGGLFPRLAFRARPGNWLVQGLALTRRYPLLISAASALLSGAGKRRSWWRKGAGLLLSWQLARMLGDSRKDPKL